MSTTFFEEMSGFSQFNDLTDPTHYHSVPDDWWVVITDVIGSTRAVEAGRYKDVNTVGAATLAAIRNAIPDVHVPFVFGGDGASAVIPEQYRSSVVRELSALRSLAKEQFELGLRVGMIQVAQLKATAGPVYVAKFLLSGQYPLALFRGGALSKADTMIKQDAERYEIPHIEGADTDLRALSCRWKAIDASHGCALSVLAAGVHDDDRSIGELLVEIDRILAPGTDAANPVNTDRMMYRGLFEMLKADHLHQRSFWARLKRQFDTVAAYVLFRLGLRRALPRFDHYVQATPAHSDYRKFDDVLRMIIDCSPEQATQIEAVCSALGEKYGMTYGLHRNQCFLMTCYAPGFGDGQHVHFIDGADGGYTLAAKQLKSQTKVSTDTGA